MNVFIAGSTGYIGRHLIPELIARGHTVRALVRTTSIGKLPEGAEPVVGDPLNASTFAKQIAPSDTFIQLVGVPHPSPAKAKEFETIDLAAVRESIKAIEGVGVRHYIYLSVAQPAPVMKAYIAVRAEGERLVRDTGIPATFVRPFYVLGPGHRWPYLFLPFFWLFAERHIWPVKLRDVVRAIVNAAEDGGATPPRVIEAPEIRRAGASPARPDATTAPAHPRA